MENVLRDKNNNLSEVNYDKVLKLVKENIKNLQIDVSEKKIDFNNLDLIVSGIVETLIRENKSIINTLEIQRGKKPSDITSLHKDKDNFITNIINISKEAKAKVTDFNIPLQALEGFKAEIKNKNFNFGLEYDFKDKELFKKRLTFNKGDNLKERLRVDEVEIGLSIKDIERNFKKNLINYISEEDMDEDLLEERVSDIESGKREVASVIRVLNDESLARIKRTISYLYLEYLLENANATNKNINLFRDYVRRFKLLEEYLKILSTKPDSESIIPINQGSYNLCNLLSLGDAFSCLPLIGLIEGNILEDRSEENKRFKVALKLKLNGEVKKENNISSFMYWLKIITGELIVDKRDDKKRARTFFLYFFMFNRLGEENYDPIQGFNGIKEFITQKGFDAVANQYVKHVIESKSEEKVRSIKEMLETIIKYKAAGLKTEIKKYARSLILYRGILTDDLEGQDLFQKVGQPREYLKYVAIVEEEANFKNILISIPIEITIKSNKLYESGESEKTKLSYNFSNIKSVPLVFYPMKKQQELRIKYANNFSKYFNEIKDRFYIAIPYPDEEELFKEENEKAYLYRLVYMTMVYMLSSSVLENVVIDNKKNLFIPIIRFHHEKQVEEANFIRVVSKVLEHVFSIDYRSTSQGFNVNKEGNYTKNIYLNAASSLYSRIPKVFDEKVDAEANKVAMIIVTSRKCDGAYGNYKDSVNTLLGEVILFNALEDGRTICDSYKTFGENYSNDELYKRPIVLNDIVKELYEKGYKHILYIAKAPYSSKINITSKEDSLFFMNESILQLMKTDKQDLMVYPLYYDHFYAIDHFNNSKEALYIRDTRELDANLLNLNKAIAGVFNLYSGKVVGVSDNSKHYKSVILYSTLCNMYNDKVLNAKMYKALIDNNSFKSSITNLVTLLHYSRYEADVNINVKIDPYEKLIGDDGVAAISVFKCNVEKLNFNFNSLAYLLDLKNVMDRENGYGRK